MRQPLASLYTTYVTISEFGKLGIAADAKEKLQWTLEQCRCLGIQNSMQLEIANNF